MLVALATAVSLSVRHQHLGQMACIVMLSAELKSYEHLQSTESC